MEIKYEEKELVSFGNYLLSAERDKITSQINKTNVTHADLENWKETGENLTISGGRNLSNAPSSPLIIQTSKPKASGKQI